MMRNREKSPILSLWDEPWWLEEQCLNHFSLNKSEMSEKVEIARSVMDEAWLEKVESSEKTNAAIASVLGRGTQPLGQILRVSNFVTSLSHFAGFKRKLSEYLNGDHIEGRAIGFELDIATQLVMGGAEISFPREQASKTPDIHGTYLDRPFCVECKFVREQQWEEATGDFMLKLASSERIHNSNPRKLNYRVDLDPALSGLTMPRSKPKSFDYEVFNHNLFTAILHLIETRLCELLQKEGYPSEFVEPGLFKISTSESNDSGEKLVTGASASLAHTSREVIRRVVEACPQLYANEEGYVVVHSHHPTSNTILGLQFTALTDSNPNLAADLNGVMVIPQAYWGYTPPNAFVVKEETPFALMLAEQFFLSRTKEA